MRPLFVIFILSIIITGIGYSTKILPFSPNLLIPSSYKLIIVKESGFYNIYTFHSLEAASAASEYLKDNIHAAIKEKIIAD